MFPRAVSLHYLLIAFLLAVSPLSAADSQGPTAIVLCYHGVETPGGLFSTASREAYHQQMQYLASAGYSVIPLSTLVDYVAGRRSSIPHNSVVVTVDDGWRSAYTEIFPEMKKFGLPFTVFVYPKFIGGGGLALSWKEIKEMSQAGVEIQSHSYSHAFLTHRRHRRLGDRHYKEWLLGELANSKEMIERETGRPVHSIAYPYGDYDSKVASTVPTAGYEAALTCDFGPVKRGSDPFRMKRVVIYANTSFAAFRANLGVQPLTLQNVSPVAGKLLDRERPVISATIPNFRDLDPGSVGMALLNVGRTPYHYNPANGRISTVVREKLKSNQQQAIVWGNDRKTGKRVETIWTFYTQSVEQGGPSSAQTARSPAASSSSRVRK